MSAHSHGREKCERDFKNKRVFGVNVTRHPYSTCAAEEGVKHSSAAGILQALPAGGRRHGNPSLWDGDYGNPASPGGVPDHGSAMPMAAA